MTMPTNKELESRPVDDKELETVSGGFTRTGDFYDEPVVYTVKDYATAWNTVSQLR
ncbi:hypothetical protein ACRQ5Q_43695 (plasmid) [Bradyrhizobium sp. PMVTL-01]|uniref:hypothetical protein n=1 Tax=Bradyrhizobium sp. PMVTL-01 TaxID=3434999 RepID=UPI003F715647